MVSVLSGSFTYHFLVETEWLSETKNSALVVLVMCCSVLFLVEGVGIVTLSLSLTVFQ